MLVYQRVTVAWLVSHGKKIADHPFPRPRLLLGLPTDLELRPHGQAVLVAAKASVFGRKPGDFAGKFMACSANKSWH